MKEKLKFIIKELKEREKYLLEFTNKTSGVDNEYWTGKWYEVNRIKNDLEMLLLLDEVTEDE